MDTRDLEGQPLFEGIGKRDLDAIARWGDLVDVSEGYQLLYQGNLPHEFFVILEGRADVRRDTRLLRPLGPGDFLGEISLVTDSARTATVTALTPLRVLVITDRAFRTLMHKRPDIQSRVLEAVAARLDATSA